jgi:hypothetical protein
MEAGEPSREELVALTLAGEVVEMDVTVAQDFDEGFVHRIGPSPQTYCLGGDEYQALVVEGDEDRATLIVQCAERRLTWKTDLRVPPIVMSGDRQKFWFRLSGKKGLVVVRVRVVRIGGRERGSLFT